MLKIIVFLAVFFLLTLTAQASAKRIPAGDSYPYVGYGLVDGAYPHCTYTIVRHGLLVTAKHCFRSASPQVNRLSIVFPHDLRIPASAMHELTLDAGDNDLAWVTYDSSVTERRIDLPMLTLADQTPAMGTALEMPGSPSIQLPRPFLNVIDCAITGKSGYFPPKPHDEGYQGLFLEIECPAWYGQSGSPVLGRDDSGGLILYGVLTHTFEILDDGSVDPAKIDRDEFGDFVHLSMFSSMSLRKSAP